MKPRDIFGLIVRSFGLGIFLFGMWYLLSALSDLAGIDTPRDKDEMRAFFPIGAACVLVAVYFLRGAPHLVRFCYPEVRDESRRDAA